MTLGNLRGRSLLSDYDIMDCIEQGLSKFGSGIKYAVMWRMVVLGDSQKKGILSNPQAFVSALESIFGASSKIIEWEIMDEIKARTDPEYSEVQDLIVLLSLLRRREQNLLSEPILT